MARKLPSASTKAPVWMARRLRARYGDRVIGYQSEDPTTEILARDIFHHLRQSLDDYRSGEPSSFPLRASVRVVSVKVWETSGSWAEFVA